MSKTITLPNPDEMLRRLMVVNEVCAAALCSLLLEAAGKKLNGVGVVHAVVLAIAEYGQYQPRVVVETLRIQTIDFITALIDDEEVRRDALTFFSEAEANMRATAEAALPPNQRS